MRLQLLLQLNLPKGIDKSAQPGYDINTKQYRRNNVYHICEFSCVSCFEESVYSLT